MKVARCFGLLLVWFIVWVAISGIMTRMLFPPAEGIHRGAFNLDWRNLPGMILGLLAGVLSLRQGWRWLPIPITTLAACWAAWQVAKLEAYSSESRRIWNALDSSLREKRPQNISQEEWDTSVGWTITAQCNVFFSPEHASYQAMKSFGDALDDKLQKDVDDSIIEWIWDQFAKTGPAGKHYVDKFWPVLQADVQAIRNRNVTLEGRFL